jgi:arylsulfatase A-like enzyme
MPIPSDVRFFRVVLTILATITLSSGLLAADASRPNVVLFLVDDMGWIDCGAYGSQFYDTPNIDRFAKRAMRFTSAYACPLCSPTRASLLSGQYSARHGITSATGHQPPQPSGFEYLPKEGPPKLPVVLPISKNYLEPSQYTLAEALHDAGYRTAHIGKWHLGATREYWPEKQGFDVAFHCHPDPGPPSYFSPYGVTLEGEPKGRNHVGTITDGPPGEYIVDRLGEEAVKFIEASRGGPFYLNLWQYGVHGPWGHKEALTREYAKRTDPRGKQSNPIMASMLKSVDDSFGRLLDKLDELQLTERTIVIFMSDNGGNTHSNVPGTTKTARAEEAKSEQLKDWRRWAGDKPPTNNDPLRDGKGTLYEGGTRVPLMIAWAGVVPSGTTSDEVVGAVDIYPTVRDLLGIAPNPAQKIDGVSLVPVVRATGRVGREAYFNYFPHGAAGKPPGVWVRSGDWKLIRWFMTSPQFPDKFELYNLRDDLGETQNLASAMPEQVRELDGRIDGFLRDTGATIPRPNPAYVAKDNKLGSWKAQGCKADIRDGVATITGENQRPFLGTAGLQLVGPVELKLRVRGGGQGRFQWRTEEQEQFPKEGQIVDFDIPKGDTWQDVSLRAPVQGTLVHCRIYLPAQTQPVVVDSVELVPASGSRQRWTFDD